MVVMMSFGGDDVLWLCKDRLPVCLDHDLVLAQVVVVRHVVVSAGDKRVVGFLTSFVLCGWCGQWGWLWLCLYPGFDSCLSVGLP